MLKYILIWLCIGYLMTLIYFIYYYNFDVNVLLDGAEVYAKKYFSDLTDEDINVVRSSNARMQIIVGIIVIIFMAVWPILIVNFVRTFKRKLR